MSVFEDPEQWEWLTEELNKTICIQLYYPVGSTVLYIPDKKKFIVNQPGTKLSDLSDKQIVIGVVLEHLNDNSCIVMYKGFFNKEPFKLSWDQVTSTCYNQNSVGPIIAKQFTTLSNNLHRYLDKNGLPKLKFMLPSNRHFDIIFNNLSVIIESLKEIVGENKANAFQKTILENKIFCNLNGHIITWEVPQGDNNLYYKIATITTSGYFLPVIHLKLN